MRLPFLLSALLLIVLRVQAQAVPEPSTFAGSPPLEIVVQWLHSPDPRLRAWAAHEILVNRFTDLVPDLESQLERSMAVGLPDAVRLSNFRATMAILDTLIQLGATVPAAMLNRIDKLGYNASVEELVLLSRLPWEEAGPAIQSFYKPSMPSDFVETRVATQLLAQRPPKGFAAELLSSIVVTGHIVVHDTKNGWGMGWGSSSCCGVGIGNISDDWPEIGRYAFRDPPEKGQPMPENETLFVSAPDPIYLLRVVSRKYAAGGCGGLSPLSDAIRSHLVGVVLHANSTNPFPEQPVLLDILFKTRESYRAQVQAFVDEQQENFSNVAWMLTRLGLLTEEERQVAALRINLSLQDTRTRPLEDLPLISFRPPVRWVSAGSPRE